MALRAVIYVSPRLKPSVPHALRSVITVQITSPGAAIGEIHNPGDFQSPIHTN